MLAFARSRMIPALIAFIGMAGAFAISYLDAFPIPSMAVVYLTAEGDVAGEVAGPWLLGGAAALIAVLLTAISSGGARLETHGPSRSAVDDASQAKALDDISGRLNTSLEVVLGLLHDALASSGKYSELLATVERDMSRVNDVAAIKKTVKLLIAENAAIRGEVDVLNGRLADAKDETEQLRNELEDARNEGSTDSLTGLKNRRWFDARLSAEIGTAQRSAQPLCLALVDVDSFKRINDSFGHQTGDTILQWIAGRILENVKGRDCAARFGGEEFAIILPDTQLKAGAGLMEQLRIKLEKTNWTHKSSGRSIGRVTASFGVTELGPGDDAPDLVERADQNLYAAKSKGRNRVVAK
ncbi:MAG: GGDEF domain-containing protein [Pseudomonadota bacterium]